MEDSWRTCYEWTKNTGQGILENPSEGQASYDAAVARQCSFYYDLLDVMIDRAATAPKVMNADIDKETTDEDSDVDPLATDPLAADAAPNDASAAEDIDTVAGSVTASTSDPTAVAATTAIVPTPVPVKKATTKKGPKHASSRTPSPSPFMDKDTVSMFAMAKNKSEERMLEVDRHNKAIERLEERKVKLEEQKMSWKSKTNEMTYKLEMVERYDSLVAKKWTDDQIVALHPSLQAVIDARNPKKPRVDTDDEAAN